MKSFFANSKGGAARYSLAIAILALCALAAAPLLSRAQAQSSSIRVENNSSKQIRHIYLSPANTDDWGADQLNDGTLNSGSSFTISNISCPGSEIKVIAEDADGCFLSKVVTCSSEAVWTITDADTPNCGG